MEKATDNELMARVKAGDLERLGELFDRHHPRLFNFLVHLVENRHLAEDLTQDVFHRILKYRGTFNPQHTFLSWMFQIARRVCQDHWRKNQPDILKIAGNDGESPESICEKPGPDEVLVLAQDLAMLENALAGLSVEKREILVLSQIERLRHEEIARILGCEPGAVKVRVHRALKMLRAGYLALMRGKEQAV